MKSPGFFLKLSAALLAGGAALLYFTKKAGASSYAPGSDEAVAARTKELVKLVETGAPGFIQFEGAKMFATPEDAVADRGIPIPKGTRLISINRDVPAMTYAKIDYPSAAAPTRAYIPSFTISVTPV